MKISFDPMPQLRARAERRINFYRAVTPQDLAHDRKRQLAAAGEPWSPEFVAAATMEGIAPVALATLILSKPDSMMERENARRALIVAVRAAATAADINTLLTGIPEHPEDRIATLI